jgi:Immunoglobulin I-set domain
MNCIAKKMDTFSVIFRLFQVCRWMVCFCLGFVAVQQMQAAPLMEEGFNYSIGSYLAANSPWAGSSGASVSIASGNLSLTTLRGTSPAGNLLQIGGGTSRTVYRNFSSSPVTSGAVYFSALIQCTVLPTNSQQMAFFQTSGASDFTASDNPMSFYIVNASGGYCFRVAEHGENSQLSKTLTVNTTHLIIIKYGFQVGGNDRVSLYIDPTPGGPEPTTADASISDITFPNLQLIGFYSPSLASQGGWNFDTMRVGTNWADVTPVPVPLTVTDPQNQAVCFGSGVSFSVTATGTPPVIYHWRTNGVAVANATNRTFTLSNPNGNDALKNYDVVVSDAFGSVTSQVARLTFSTNAAAIVTPPTNQVVMAGAPSATFNVTVSGDAPLSIQWRTNGVAVPGETNTSYTIFNPGPADTANAIDVVVANPCGSVTSAPPVGVYFLNAFYTGYDYGAGFFGGENFAITNTPGTVIYCWSSADPSVSVTSWTLVGQLAELPLNDGSGNSRYTINLSPPASSQVYYIFATANTWPYTATEALLWLTTDVDGNVNSLNGGNIAINANGIFSLPSPPNITQQPQSQTVLLGQNTSFNVTATGSGVGYQWFFNSNSINGASSVVLGLNKVSAKDVGQYFVIITNSLGSVTSSVVTLAIAPPPALHFSVSTPGTIQLNANSVSGLTYVVQVATNLVNPVWVSILTNNTGNGGTVNFQPNAAVGPRQFYRLYFP